MMAATVLSVDDSPDDLMLLRLACESARVSFQLRAMQSGEEAIAFLEQAGREQALLPTLILLDLKMPGKSGFDVLAWLREQPVFNCVPVLVLTSSIHPEDRTRALGLGADQFLVKPMSYDRLQNMVRTLDRLLGSNPASPLHGQRFQATEGGELLDG